MSCIKDEEESEGSIDSKDEEESEGSIDSKDEEESEGSIDSKDEEESKGSIEVQREKYNKVAQSFAFIFTLYGSYKGFLCFHPVKSYL